MQSKECARLNTGTKVQYLQGGCRLFVWKFFSQRQQQGHEQEEEPLPTYVVTVQWFSISRNHLNQRSATQRPRAPLRPSINFSAPLNYC
ncbi:hypothetical protein TNCV_4743481 [Trichonephila clavipes]|nr:hypothetical protein TNCV_4743481 [Trichonephila clavipes]